jgi:DNA modification methylase
MFKPKDLIGIPWMVAFALRADGWYLRQDIIWHKPNPMPESVTDRCTKAHEYIFLLAKSERYYYDAEAVAEKAICAGQSFTFTTPYKKSRNLDGKTSGNEMNGAYVKQADTRNKRSVWTVNPKPYVGAHFATFPPDLIKPCILAGCPKKGVVLDPFGGSGTTGAVAVKYDRKAVLIELNPQYIKLAQKRVEREVSRRGLFR